MTSDQIYATLQLMGWRHAGSGVYRFTGNGWHYQYIDNVGNLFNCFGLDDDWVPPTDMYLSEWELILAEAVRLSKEPA